MAIIFAVRFSQGSHCTATPDDIAVANEAFGDHEVKQESKIRP
jgi:hypothetical protein